MQHTATVEGHVGGSAPVVLLEALLLDQLLSHDVAGSKQDLRETPQSATQRARKRAEGGAYRAGDGSREYRALGQFQLVPRQA